MPNFNIEIDWQNEDFLRIFLKTECKAGFTLQGISQKRCQIIDYMSTAQLDTQLGYLAYEFESAVNKATKKAKLLEMVNDYKVDEIHEDDSLIGETYISQTPDQTISKINVITTSPTNNNTMNRSFKDLIKNCQFVTFSHGENNRIYHCTDDKQMEILEDMFNMFGSDSFTFHESANNNNSCKRKISFSNKTNNEKKQKCLEGINMHTANQQKQPNIQHEKQPNIQHEKQPNIQHQHHNLSNTASPSTKDATQYSSLTASAFAGKKLLKQKN